METDFTLFKISDLEKQIFELSKRISDIEKRIEKLEEMQNNKTEDEVNTRIEKYVFNGKEFKKGRLVHAVISNYLEEHRDDISDIESLRAVFPKELLGHKKSFQLIESIDIKPIVDSNNKKRFFTDEPLLLKNGQQVVICNQWDYKNIKLFIEYARKLGYTIDNVNQ